MQLEQAEQAGGGGVYGVSRSSSSNGPVGPKLPSCPLSCIVYRNSEKYSFPLAAFQYLNSINSPASPMIGTEKPMLTWEETPRTTPSSMPMEAIWSQDVVPSGPVSTGCPIWTPLSVTMPGDIEAVAEKLFTSPIV